MLKDLPVVLAGVLAIISGYTDWRWRRIPNWLTVPSLALGVVSNWLASGWLGTKSSLLGASLGLLLLLPLVLVRGIGAGDWKAVGAFGACLGPHYLLVVLGGAVFIAGIMAISLVIYKRRLRETVENIGRLLLAFATGRPGLRSVSLDNPASLRIPFGVAVAVTVILFVGAHFALRNSL